MAISIPIISEFDGKGIAKAKQEFSQLEGVGEKAQFALKKAAIPAAAAVAGIGAALFDATKGAMEDAAAQANLARNLTATTGATDQQIAAVEDWISAQGKALGIADDDLRPAFEKLARATGSVTEAQKLASQAMDIAQAKGLPLETVVKALEKAYGGNMTALQKLAPEYRDLIKAGASFEEVMFELQNTTGGAARTFAETAEGGMKRLSLSIAETKESIGAALLPVVEAALPVLNRFADWAADNPETFQIIAIAIGGIATAILLINAAMALNPFTATALAIGGIVTAVVIAYKKFEWFRNGVKTIVNGIAGYFEFLVNSWITVINTIIRGINLVKPGKDIKLLGKISIGELGGMESAPAPVGADISRFQGMSASPVASAQSVTINVNGGDPQAVVGALRRYMQTNGSVPIRVTG